MSELDDFMTEGLGELIEVAGETSFTIEDRAFSGRLEPLADQDYTIIAGGKELQVRSQLIVPRAQFDEYPPIAAPALGGQRLTLTSGHASGRRFLIAAVSEDSVAFTLTLSDPDAH